MQLGLSQLSLTGSTIMGGIAAGGIVALQNTLQTLYAGQMPEDVSAATPAFFSSEAGSIAFVEVQILSTDSDWASSAAGQGFDIAQSVRLWVGDTAGNTRAFTVDTDVEEAIRATLSPKSPALYAGQSLSDLADFSAVTSPQNFTIKGAPAQVDQLVLTYSGDAQDGTSPLQEGDMAGYDVTVSDGAVSRTYTAPPNMTTYGLRVVLSGEDLRFDVNDLLPLDTDILVSFLPPTPYATQDAGYGPGVGRYNAAQAVAGPAQIFAPVISGMTAPGAILSAQPGLYHGGPDGGPITQSGQWHDVTGALPGEIGLNFTNSVAGGRYRYVETLSDANGSQSYASHELTIEGGA